VVEAREGVISSIVGMVGNDPDVGEAVIGILTSGE
jgi:hypothetical protein